MKNLFHYFLALLIIGLSGCNTKKPKSAINIEFIQDTLSVGYTYWWPDSGPFIGQCGDELSLVFSGTIIDLQEPTNAAGPLYTSQEGTIEIEHLYKIKELSTTSYANQQFITADCFAGLGLTLGDTVLVFCYDYEGGYTLPGGKSILKITGFEDPLIRSIRTYIDSEEDALSLKKDSDLWSENGLGPNLARILECAQEGQN